MTETHLQVPELPQSPPAATRSRPFRAAAAAWRAAPFLLLKRVTDRAATDNATFAHGWREGSKMRTVFAAEGIAAVLLAMVFPLGRAAATEESLGAAAETVQDSSAERECGGTVDADCLP